MVNKMNVYDHLTPLYVAAGIASTGAGAIAVYMFKDKLVKYMDKIMPNHEDASFEDLGNAYVPNDVPLEITNPEKIKPKKSGNRLLLESLVKPFKDLINAGKIKR